MYLSIPYISASVAKVLNPADTKRKNNVIRFDVVMTLLLRRVSVGI